MRSDEYRAYVEAIVLHALTLTPRGAWTRQKLATWYDVKLDVVEQVLDELIAAGRIRRLPGALEAYEQTPALRAVV